MATVEPRQLVFPGTLLAEGRYEAGNNTYSECDKVFSSVIGLAEIRGNMISVIALRSCYMPNVGDVVIGKVVECIPTAWMLDIRAPYQGVLFASEYLPKPLNPMKEEARKYLDVGEMVVAKVLAFDRTRNPSLTTKDQGLGKVQAGTVIEVDFTRVPRIIGKRGSMISLLKKETNTQIFVGQNGRVWISGKTREDEALVAGAIRKIEAEAHTTGLTDRIHEYLVKGKKEKEKEIEREKETEKEKQE